MDGKILGEGIVGIVTTTAGIVISYQQEVEFGFRIASLCVGMTVGILSAIHIYQKITYEKIKRRKENDKVS